MDSGYPSSGRALNTPGDLPELRNLVVQCHNALNRSTRRRPCELTGASLGRSVWRAISVARARAALTAAIPRSSRALVRPTSFGAAKSCSLVIIFMIRPPTAQSSDSNNAHRSRPHHGSPAFHWGVQFQAGMSPTCTAVQAPPRAVDVGKSSGSVGGCRASRADQVLLRITPSFSARGAAVLGCRAARAEMHSALAAYNVRHAHLVRCLFGKTRSRHPCAPNAGMRCGLPASSRQCGRCLGWSSTYTEAADTSEPPNASPIPHHRSGFDRRAAYDIPCAGTRERQ